MNLNIFIGRITLLTVFILGTSTVPAQQGKTDSLRRLILSTQVDTVKIFLYANLAFAYRNEKKIDSSVFACKQALELSQKINQSPSKWYGDLGTIAYLLYEMGNYSESLEYASRYLPLSVQLNDTFSVGLAHLVFGHDYRELAEYRQSLSHYFKARESFKLFWVMARNQPEDFKYGLLCIANTYLKMKKLDSAMVYAQEGRKLSGPDGVLFLLSTRILADIYFAKGDDETALNFYRQYIPDYVKYKETNRDLGFALNGMAKIFQKRGEGDSARFYAERAFSNALQYSDQQNLFDAGMILSDYYTVKDDHKALNYLRIAMRAKDSMVAGDKQEHAQLLAFNERVREKDQAAADLKEAAKSKLIIAIAAVLILIISFLIWNRMRQLRLRYKAILEQKEAAKLKAEYAKELLDMEARVLRAQMNPHFIFNCLTSINRYIVKSDHKTASNYLTRFSKLIRLILDNSAADYVSLDAEIQTLQLYIDMEALRFDHAFDYEIQTNDAVVTESISIPSMLVQPYAENAIWHGLLHLPEEGKREKGKLWIRFLKEEENILKVEIEDNGVGRQKAKEIETKDTLKKKSYGMQISKDRIELINRLYKYNSSVRVEDLVDAAGNAAGTKIVLTIPVSKILTVENLN